LNLWMLRTVVRALDRETPPQNDSGTAPQSPHPTVHERATPGTEADENANLGAAAPWAKAETPHQLRLPVAMSPAKAVERPVSKVRPPRTKRAKTMRPVRSLPDISKWNSATEDGN
jgi:hypothetical protein